LPKGIKAAGGEQGREVETIYSKTWKSGENAVRSNNETPLTPLSC